MRVAGNSAPRESPEAHELAGNHTEIVCVSGDFAIVDPCHPAARTTIIVMGGALEVINSRLVSWASILDDNTREQALATAQLSIIYPHLALMPDAHLGLGATVGPSSHAGRRHPAAVGVDIGCGMIAVRTQYAVKDLPKHRKRLREGIEHAIPLSAGHFNHRISATAVPRSDQLRRLAAEARFDFAQYAANWTLQLGSLGSGNHVIEVCADETDAV